MGASINKGNMSEEVTESPNVKELQATVTSLNDNVAYLKKRGTLVYRWKLLTNAEFNKLIKYAINNRNKKTKKGN
jgi:hypothetical protein